MAYSRSSHPVGDGFWRTAPRPAAATLLLLCALGLAIVGTPWAIAAAGVILAPGLWGVMAAVARVVHWRTSLLVERHTARHQSRLPRPP